MIEHASKWLARFRRMAPWSQTFFLAVLIGVSAGAVASLLRSMMDGSEQLFFAVLGADGTYTTPPLRPGMLVLLPALGGLLAGWLVSRVDPEAGGGGTESVVTAFHTGKLIWRWRLLPTKLLASSLSVGMGIAGGVEGPISQVGALIGQRWAALFGLNKARQKEFFTAGVAAGIGAIFHAPLGGALFAAEVYYRRPDVESKSLLPALLASSLGFTVFNLWHGWQPLLPVPPDTILSARAVAMLVVLSVTCGLMSRWTLRLIEGSRRALAGIPDGLRPGFAGLLAGTLVLAVLLGAQRLAGEGSQPSLVVASLGEGYGILRLAAGGIYPLWTLLMLMLALRIATTALAQGSSSAVGAFAPAMVIGAATGLATGSLASWSGIYQGSPVPMALAGMAAFFAASFRSPLASVVMIAEVSQGYAMLPALMLASAIGYLSGPDPGWIHTQKKARGSRD